MRCTSIAMRLLRLLPWFMPFGLNAQLLHNNGAVITINSLATVDVNGDLMNNGTGVIDNNGSMVISGNFVHNASNTCFAASHGTVVLDGAAQGIGGSDVAVFNNLVLTGTGPKTLMQHVEVGGAYAAPMGVLDLDDRTLDLNGYDLTVLNPLPTAITRTSGYVISERDPGNGYSFVRWNVGQNTGNYTMPFGNAATNDYLPFTAAITTPGVGTTGYIRMATYPTVTLASPNNRPLPTAVPSLVDVSGMENAPNVLDRWWVMESGNFTASPIATTTFAYRDGEWSTGTNTITESALQLERQMGVWNMFPTVTDIAANTLTATGIPLMTSSWTAAMLAAPLPVELLSFTGKRLNEREVQLDWSTATEQNNAGFEVWRMIEGEDDFTEVGWADGAGNSQQLINYLHPDNNRASKTSYYKLKQVDTDGQYEWSTLVAVEGAGFAAQLVAYPNPARDVITLIGLPENTTTITMHDASGRLVKQWSSTTMLTELGVLERGVYLLNALDADGGVFGVRVALE